MQTLLKTLACLVVFMTLMQPALAADPWHQSFNKVSVIPWSKNHLGGTAIGTGAIDGTAVLNEWSQTVSGGGAITVSGSADFDDLKLYIEMYGGVADHRGTAISHKLFSISDPNVTAGTLGSMSLSYSFGGTTTIDGGPGNSVTYGLQVTKDVTNQGTGGTLIEYQERTAEPPANAATGFDSFNAAVPFTYGDEFRVTTIFSVRLQSDQDLALPTYQSIIADFSNSATLDAIYIPEGASISFASNSDFDLMPLVRFGTPVPLPAPIVLLFSALSALFCAGFRARRPSAS